MRIIDLPILLNAKIIRYPRYNMKNKMNLFLPFSINSRSFVSAFHALLTTSFSLDPFICLSYSAGYYFTFSTNRLAEPTFKEAGEGGGGLKSGKTGTLK